MNGSPEIPSWVPQAVIDAAAEIRNTIPPEQSASHTILNRLLCHRDMEGVWREISRKRKDPSGAFFHPAQTFADRAKIHRVEATRMREKGEIVEAKSSRIRREGT